MNSIIAGWNRGIQFDASSGVPVDRNVTDSTIIIKNIVNEITKLEKDIVNKHNKSLSA